MNEIITKNRGMDVWDMLIVKDDVIISKTSTLAKGVNKYSGKSYARFKDNHSTILSWKQGGRMRCYSKTAKTRQRPGSFHDDTTAMIAPPGYRVSTNIREGIKLRFNEDVQAVFDREYPMRKFVTPAPGLTPHLVATDAADLTRRLYGPKNYRRDLVRAVGGLLEYAPNDSTAGALKGGMMVQGYVPVDWVVDWLPRIARESRFSDYDKHVPTPAARRLFRSMSDKQRRRLVTTDGALQGFGDTVTMFEKIRNADPGYGLADLQFTSFKELHDVLARDERRMKEPRLPIQYKGKAKKLPGQYGEYRIVAPEDTWSLTDWGTDMGNCISGYGRRAAEGAVLLYAVYDTEGVMVANMELSPKGDIRQLLGKYNAGVSAEIQDTVYDAIQAQWPNASVMGGWQGTIHNPRRGGGARVDFNNAVAQFGAF